MPNSDVERILGVLRATPDGLTRQELLTQLRKQVAWLRPQQLEALIEAAGSAIVLIGDRLAVPADDVSQPKLPFEGEARPIRMVAFDIESVVRLTAAEPYTERRTYQLGGVRFGPDRKWVHENRKFNSYVAMPAEVEALLERESIRNRYFNAKREPAIVLEEFRRFVSGADVVIAYNGEELDFPLIRQECERAQVPPLEFAAAVDGYYLALALWPVPPRQHTLRQLRERLMLDVGEGRWHDALWDAHVLSILLTAGSRMVEDWARGLQELVRSASQESVAWNVIFGLMRDAPKPLNLSDRDVGDVLANALAGKAQLRQPPEAGVAVPHTFEIIPRISEDGHRDRIDVLKLAREAKGFDPEPRQSQRDMVAAMRRWIVGERDALVEAPTGTGKSYAMLSLALEWLAAAPSNRVVISTFTKQLQSQLARDLQDLSTAGILQDLGAIADLVKGQSNRLSLRALVRALADLSAPPTARGTGTRTPDRLRTDPRYSELVLYLTLRYIARGEPIEEWESKSVDVADVPAFFEKHSGGRGRYQFFLHTLSQATNGEFGIGYGPLALHTTTVREALERHRLVIANHALLLAHLDDFEEIGPNTLLMVDEAHALEDAATDALTPRFDYQDLEAVFADISEWQSGQPPNKQLTALNEVIGELERFLYSERVPITAMTVFDTQPRDPIHAYARKVTVASPLTGRSRQREMEALIVSLRLCANYLYPVRLRLLETTLPDDLVERERFQLLYQRLVVLNDSIYRIARHGYDALGIDWPQRTEAPVLDQLEPRVEEEPDSGAEAPTEDQADDTAVVEPAELETVVPMFNRVVWAEEADDAARDVARRGKRYFRFTMGSSPILLGEEGAYRRFIVSFGPTFYISATLRVADPRRGDWAYIRERLALTPENVDAHSLPSPFDAAKQARLVCFEDFPSWAEQSDMAMRTVAYHLAGYAREMVRGVENGAMVLTTSREAAARIADQLLQLRSQMAADYVVSAAPVPLSNQRAVDEFKASGGFLVGTRGLWQGVDVDKAERLRLVWINKLPFAAFGDPVVEARRAIVALQADLEGAEDPEQVANERYYLPMGALQLRQAVGRLIRTKEHRGVIVISDRKLGGPTRLRRLYRQVFLGSLDPGLLVEDEETREPTGGNVVTMSEGWRRIWGFFAQEGMLTPERSEILCQPLELERHTLLPQVRAIREQALTKEQVAEIAQQGPEAMVTELLNRSRVVGGLLALRDGPIELKSLQDEAIREIAHGKDVLAVLPTGYGKSFIFQLPALVLPGVTVVVSPLVSLMTDQALALNRSIGGAVRALVAPMRESNSRTGKVEVQQQLTDPDCRHGIRLVYLSPERLCQRQFQDWLREGVRKGIVERVAIDEAHTFAQWGDDFRPSFRRAEMLLRELKVEKPTLQIIALTATANRGVREDLLRGIFGIASGEETNQARFALISANPIRPELAVYRRRLGTGEGGRVAVSGLVERVVDTLEEHAIFYCLTVKQVEAEYSHLADYLGDQRDRLRKYHGRMAESEKASVANDFKGAPKKGEDGFRPMIVVATSAFGLGVDRPDIRTVFAVSPPTDLAALYQQLGRAGRDHTVSSALALADYHAFRVIRFMNQRRVEPHLHWMIAQAIVESAPLLDARALANRVAMEEFEAGRIDRGDLDAGIEGQYVIEVMRVLAALAFDGVIDDLGDFPARVEIRTGEVAPDTGEMREQIQAILDSRPHKEPVVALPDLYEAVRGEVAGEADDIGAFWSLLLKLHADGYLDVSQRPNTAGRYITGVRTRDKKIAETTIARLSRRQRVLDEEYSYLLAWFEDEHCCNEGFAKYFISADADSGQLPEGTCATPQCRCSTCWQREGAGGDPPALLTAFKEVKPRPASANLARKRDQARLDRYVENLLWQNRKGLGFGLVFKVLRGETTYFSKSKQKAITLWPELTNSRVFNVRPGLRQADLAASVERLEAAGVVVRDGGFWRLKRWVDKYGWANPESATAIPI